MLNPDYSAYSNCIEPLDPETKVAQSTWGEQWVFWNYINHQLVGQDRLYEAWEQKFLHGENHIVYVLIDKVGENLELLFQNVGVDEPILELNAGAAGFKSYHYDLFEQNKHRVIAADFATEMLESNESGDKLLVDNNQPLKFAPESLPAIISLFGMRYVRDHQRFILELIRALRPGGEILIIDFQENDHDLEVNEFDPQQIIEQLGEITGVSFSVSALINKEEHRHNGYSREKPIWCLRIKKAQA